MKLDEVWSLLHSACMSLSERRTAKKLTWNCLSWSEALVSCLPLAHCATGTSTIKLLTRLTSWGNCYFEWRTTEFFSWSWGKCKVATKSCKDPQNLPSKPFIPKWALTHVLLLRTFPSIFLLKDLQKRDFTIFSYNPICSFTIPPLILEFFLYNECVGMF